MICGAMLPFVSCSDDDDNPYEHESTISVVSSDVIFGGGASAGSVVVNAPQGVTSATFPVSWATATVTGDTVKVAVEANPDLEGRTALLTIKSGNDSVQVPVTQTGFVFNLSTGTAIQQLNDAAASRSYHLEHSTDVNVSLDSLTSTWLTAAVEGDSLKVSFTANNTGKPRLGYIYYTSGNISDSIRVTQYELNKDILGDYVMYYYNGGWQYVELNLSRRANGSYALRFSDESYASLGVSIPVQIDSDYPGFTITNLDSCGVYTYNNTRYTVLAMIMTTNGQSVYRNSNRGLQAHVMYTMDGDEGFFDVVGEGITDDTEFYALRLGLSSNGQYSGYYAALLNFPYPQFDKLVGDDEEGAKPFRLAKKSKVSNRWKAPQLLPEVNL